jgi:hypothetical protein
MSSDIRCRCGCLLAKVSLPGVQVAFDGDDHAPGIEIRCRRCKTLAHIVPQATGDELHDAE